MRFPALWIAAALIASGPATAQAQVDISGKILDLAMQTRDLVFVVEDIEGGVASLEAVESDLAVEESETEIRIELAADVLFDFDSADLRPEAEAALGNVAEIIRAHEGARVRVEGHTDSKGSAEYNQALSEMRSESVRDWLLAAEGLGGTSFATTGFGESQPAAANETADGSDDPEGRQKNRRVEIVVEKQ